MSATLNSTVAAYLRDQAKRNLEFADLLDAKPAKAPAAPKAAPKPKAQAKVDTKAPAKAKGLCKATRLAFIKAASVDFSGWSTKAIAAACIEDPSLVPAGFVIGEGYKTLLAG